MTDRDAAHIGKDDGVDYGSAIIVEGLDTLALSSTRQPIYDQEFGIASLHQDAASGAEHYLIRYPAGMKAQSHRHTAAHTIVVLEGAIEANQPMVAVIAADNAPGARDLLLDVGAAAPPAPVGLLRQEAPHGVGVQPAGIVVELVGRVMDHERRAYADRFGAMSETDAIPYEPPDAGDELATLVGSLERQRRTFECKCSGLDAAGMRATIRASAITLGGLVKHVSLVEASYFQERLHARDPGSPWNTVDWDQDPNWDWRTGAEDPPQLVLALWHDTVARSREALHEALERGCLEQLGRYTWPDGRS